MNRTVIVFASTHHGNTRKLAEAFAERYDADLIDAEVQSRADLSRYALIGFASGIAFGKFYDSVERFVQENLPENSKVFFLYTCARKSNRFTETIREKTAQKHALVLGEYGCRGYNTYGPLKLFGGMNKNHPNDAEIEEALQFYQLMIRKMGQKSGNTGGLNDEN